MAHLHDIVVDCAHPASLARFWAEVLDGYAVAPYDDDEIARLRAEGVDDPEDDPTVLVEPTDPGQPRLFFQLVPEDKVVKNRWHIDLSCDDVESELDRLLALGATVFAHRDRWVTLLDPEGNEFCVLR